jgi:SAM-dependent methyltransferase
MLCDRERTTSPVDAVVEDTSIITAGRSIPTRMSNTGFSDEWDELWKSRESSPSWPWTDVVSLVHRHCHTDEPRVLELGPGAGANVPFFQSIDADYRAIEGSEAAVKELLRRFPDLEDQVAVADFTQRFPFKGPFDIVLDRGSITANPAEGVRRTLSSAHDVLASDGRLVSIDLYSTADRNYGRGESGPDEYTRHSFSDGRFEGMGNIHFFDREHIDDLFGAFEPLLLEHTTTTCHVPDDVTTATWRFVGTPS